MITNQKKRRIVVLPVAGREDPGQLLRMEGWRSTGRYEVISGVPGRFFAGSLSCLKFHPDLLYFDWIGRYISGRNPASTLAKRVAFFIDIQIVTRIFRKPIVWTLHNLRDHEGGQADGGAAWFQRYFARHASIIRVFSKGSVNRAAAVLGIGQDKIRVVPEGDFSSYYPNAITPTDARARLGLADGEFALLWLGSIRPYKGLHELIHAFRQAALPNWRLIIAGRPYIRGYAEEIAGLVGGDPRIQLQARFIPEDELQVFYNAADAVVLPFTEVENSGSVCVAMGFRKAVVAPDLGVISERLHRQKELVYPPGELAPALQRAAALPPARLNEYGAANFAEIRTYRWGLLAAAFQELEKPSTTPSRSS